MQGDRMRSYIHGFTTQMPTTVRAGQHQSQDPEISSQSRMWVIQVFELSPASSQDTHW